MARYEQVPIAKTAMDFTSGSRRWRPGRSSRATQSIPDLRAGDEGEDVRARAEAETAP